MNFETSLNALVNDGGNHECKAFVIANFPHVVNVVFFLLGDSLASEFHVPTFQNRQSVLKRRHITFRRRGITQKKEYDNVRPVCMKKEDNC